MSVDTFNAAIPRHPFQASFALLDSKEVLDLSEQEQLKATTVSLTQGDETATGYVESIKDITRMLNDSDKKANRASFAIGLTYAAFPIGAATLAIATSLLPFPSYTTLDYPSVDFVKAAAATAGCAAYFFIARCHIRAVKQSHFTETTQLQERMDKDKKALTKHWSYMGDANSRFLSIHYEEHASTSPKQHENLKIVASFINNILPALKKETQNAGLTEPQTNRIFQGLSWVLTTILKSSIGLRSLPNQVLSINATKRLNVYNIKFLSSASPTTQEHYIPKTTLARLKKIEQQSSSLNSSSPVWPHAPRSLACTFAALGAGYHYFPAAAQNARERIAEIAFCLYKNPTTFENCPEDMHKTAALNGAALIALLTSAYVLSRLGSLIYNSMCCSKKNQVIFSSYHEKQRKLAQQEMKAVYEGITHVFIQHINKAGSLDENKQESKDAANRKKGKPTYPILSTWKWYANQIKKKLNFVTSALTNSELKFTQEEANQITGNLDHALGRILALT